MVDRMREVAEGVLSWELSVGYASRGRLIENVGDALDAEELAVVDSIVEQLVDAALAERRREEETWREPTDHDRLVAAFDELDRSGIVSREDYGVTKRDAEREVLDEAERIATDATVRGTCTFNVQDAEGVAAGGLLYVSYASFGSDNDAPIGEEIAAALRRQGLAVEWSGQKRDRIGVRVPDWRVRCVTGDPHRPTMRGWADVWSEDDDDDD